MQSAMCIASPDTQTPAVTTDESGTGVPLNEYGRTTCGLGHEDKSYLSNVRRPIVILGFVLIRQKNTNQLPFSASHALCNVNHKATSCTASAPLSTSYPPRRISMRPHVRVTRGTFCGLFGPSIFGSFHGKELMQLHILEKAHINYQLGAM